MLSKMACYLLTPSVPTISSKFTFYIAVNILGERMTRLSDEMLEVLTCLKIRKMHALDFKKRKLICKNA